MSLNYSQGFYEVKNSEKYIGIGNPRYHTLT